MRCRLRRAIFLVNISDSFLSHFTSPFSCPSSNQFPGKPASPCHPKVSPYTPLARNHVDGRSNFLRDFDIGIARVWLTFITMRMNGRVCTRWNTLFKFIAARWFCLVRFLKSVLVIDEASFFSQCATGRISPTLLSSFTELWCVLFRSGFGRRLIRTVVSRIEKTLVQVRNREIRGHCTTPSPLCSNFGTAGCERLKSTSGGVL
jgi:hypothetical protein